MGGFLKIKLNIQLLLQGSRGRGVCRAFQVDFQIKISSTWEIKEKIKYVMKKIEGVPHWARCLTPWTSPGQNTGVGNIPLLRGSSQPRDWTQVSPLQADSLLAEPGKPTNAGVGSLSLLQGIFPTQESSQGLLHCRRVPYQLSYQGSPPYWARHPIGSFAWYPLPEASTWQPTMIHTGTWVGGSKAVGGRGDSAFPLFPIPVNIPKVFLHPEGRSFLK